MRLLSPYRLLVRCTNANSTAAHACAFLPNPYSCRLGVRCLIRGSARRGVSTHGATLSRAAMPLSASTHAAIGAVSGVIEVTLLHPTVAWKNALQEGRALNLRPTALYRGYLINVGSFAPITMAQFGVNRLLETRLSRTGDGASCGAQRALL